MSRNISVFGIFPTVNEADYCVTHLRAIGFRNTEISVLIPEQRGSNELAHEKNSKAPEGAAVGASSGVVIGGVLGWLVGVGTLAIPGVGPFLAAGPIVAALAGAGGLGVVGGLVGGLAGFGIPEYEAKRYEGRLRAGGILLSCHCDDSDWAERAKQTLELAGAEDISSSSAVAASSSQKETARSAGYGASRSM
jgi:hypothetical protein